MFNAKSQPTYYQVLRTEISDLIDTLELPELYKQSMKSRWLDQLIWTDKKASQSQQRYHLLRLTTVVGGVIIPALVAFNNFSGDITPQAYLRQIFPMVLFTVTQLVAICTAVEEFFQYGARWRQYRTTAESLKSEGWQFFQLGGAYRQFPTHLQAYPSFSTRVERIIRRDVQAYLSEIAKDQQREEEDSSGGGSQQLTPLHSGFFTNFGNTGQFPMTEILDSTTQAEEEDLPPPPGPRPGPRSGPPPDRGDRPS